MISSNLEVSFFSKLLLVGVLFTATEKQTRGASKEIVCGIKVKMVSPLWKHYSCAKSWGKAGQSIQSYERLSTRQAGSGDLICGGLERERVLVNMFLFSATER